MRKKIFTYAIVAIAVFYARAKTYGTPFSDFTLRITQGKDIDFFIKRVEKQVRALELFSQQHKPICFQCFLVLEQFIFETDYVDQCKHELVLLAIKSMFAQRNIIPLIDTWYIFLHAYKNVEPYKFLQEYTCLLYIVYEGLIAITSCKSQNHGNRIVRAYRLNSNHLFA